MQLASIGGVNAARGLSPSLSPRLTHRPVTELDIYWFDMPRAGAWQYRIDDLGWENSPTTTAVGDNKLHKLTVAQPVARRLLIRGFDGGRPCSPQSRA